MKNKYASFWQRLIAHLVDLGIGYALFIWLLTNISSKTTVSDIFSGFLSYFIIAIWYGVIYLLAQSFLISRFGGTVGKLLTGIKITDQNGDNLTFLKAIFREAGLKRISVFLFGLGFWWMIKDKEKQTWHDKAANSYVVTTNSTLTVVGILAVASLVALNVFLVRQIIQNVKRNRLIYQEIGSQIQESFEDSVKDDVESSPTPQPLNKPGIKNNYYYQYN